METIKELSFPKCLQIRAKAWFQMLCSVSMLPMEARFHFKQRKQEDFQHAPLVSVFFIGPGFFKFSSRMTYVLTIVKTNNLLLYCGSVCHVLDFWNVSHLLSPFLFYLYLMYDTPRKRVWGSVISKHFATSECLINTMSVHWSQKWATNPNSV